MQESHQRSSLQVAEVVKEGNYAIKSRERVTELATRKTQILYKYPGRCVEHDDKTVGGAIALAEVTEKSCLEN